MPKDEAHHYSTAGWMSAIYATTLIPIFIVSIVTQFVDSLRFLAYVMTGVSVGLFIYVLLSFKKLLNLRYSFDEVDRIIHILIGITLIHLPIAFLSDWIGGTFDAYDGLSLLFVIISGAVTIVFGIKLLNVSHNLFNLKKPLGYLLIANGIAYASIIFLLFGIIIDFVVAILLAVLFFKADRTSEPA